MKIDTLLFVYEPDQVDSIAQYARTPGVCVIALDFWVERTLARRGIPYESSERFKPTWKEQDALFAYAQQAARDWYRTPEMAFFMHKGIRIAEALESNVDNHVQHALYHLYVMGRALAAHARVSRIIVPYSASTVSPHSSPLSPFILNAPVAVAQLLAKRNNIFVETVGVPFPLDATRPFPPASQRNLIALAVYNSLMALVPRRSRTVFASEYWPNIASFVQKMPDVELVLMDRSEIRAISWRDLLAHRVRFRHPLQSVSRAGRVAARKCQAEFRSRWKDVRPAVAAWSGFNQDGATWWPLAEQALDFVVETYAERVVADIEGIEEIMRGERIDLALVRASVSAQHHFFIMAHVAQRLGIPSVEIQHSGGVYDPRTMHSRLEASYLAGYGPLACNLYQKVLGYDPQRLRAIGSPRFESYFSKLPSLEKRRTAALSSLGLDPARPAVLVVVPKGGMTLKLAPWTPDSYDVAHLFEAFAAVRTAALATQIVFKFRSRGYWEQHREYLNELFPDGGWAVSEEDLFSMIAVSDIVVTGFSTALYEAMIATRPLVLYPWKPDAYHNHIYEEVAPIIRDETSLIRELKELLSNETYLSARRDSGARFLARHCALDAQASDRMVAFLREPLRADPGSGE